MKAEISYYVSVSALDSFRVAAAFGSACMAGMMNSVAGGGTLVTFPTLIWLGLPSIAANATSTVAIWPGSLGSMWVSKGTAGLGSSYLSLLFLIQKPVQERMKKTGGLARHSPRWMAAAMLFQLFVAAHGGYFGAHRYFDAGGPECFRSYKYSSNEWLKKLFRSVH
ncbi:MAG TPA: hypothetical protein VFA54_04065 [Bryobacterales bacterium]|nr:hypothetical protein [Bryobacterales bacterium]